MKITSCLKLLKPNQKENKFFEVVDFLPNERGGFFFYLNIMNKSSEVEHHFFDVTTPYNGLSHGVKIGDKIYIEIKLEE